MLLERKHAKGGFSEKNVRDFRVFDPTFMNPHFNCKFFSSRPIFSCNYFCDTTKCYHSTSLTLSWFTYCVSSSLFVFPDFSIKNFWWKFIKTEAVFPLSKAAFLKGFWKKFKLKRQNVIKIDFIKTTWLEFQFQVPVASCTTHRTCQRYPTGCLNEKCLS